MKIGIVEDHQLFRDGIKALLSEFSITLEAANGMEMTEKLKSIRRVNVPDIIIVDISMPIMDGFETIDYLRNVYPNINVIVLTMRDDEESILRMIKLGVKSYLTKDTNPSELLNAIRIVYGNNFYFPDNITNVIIKSIQKENDETKVITISDLTEKEIHFIKLACTEKTYGQIAIEMGVSPRTVDGYRESLFEKLSVSSRVGLALFGFKNNLI